MASPSEHAAAETALRALIHDHDTRWCGVDLAGIAELWEHDDPTPLYVGDEYAAPLIGDAELAPHWARLGSRLASATVTSSLQWWDILGESVIRAVLLSRWRLTDRHTDVERAGASWITWLLIRRGGRYRIVHQMESQVHLPDDGR